MSKINPRFFAELAGVRTVSEVSVSVVSDTFWSCWVVPMSRNSVLEGLSANMLADIHLEMARKVVLSTELAYWKSVGFMVMYSWVSSAYR